MDFFWRHLIRISPTSPDGTPNPLISTTSEECKLIFLAHFNLSPLPFIVHIFIQLGGHHFQYVVT